MAPIDFVALFIALPIAFLATLFVIFLRRSSMKPKTMESTPEEIVEPGSRSTWVWVVTIGLAVIFFGAAVPKIGGLQAAVNLFEEWGYEPWLRKAVGYVEFVAAIFLILPKTATIAALVLAVIMAGSIYTHIATGSFVLALLPIAALCALAFVGYERLPDMLGTRSKRKSHGQLAEMT